MRPAREVIREKISALVNLEDSGTDTRGVYARCLELIDLVATMADDVHRHIPAEVQNHLATATRAASREDVAGVIVAVEQAIAAIGADTRRPPK